MIKLNYFRILISKRLEKSIIIWRPEVVIVKIRRQERKSQQSLETTTWYRKEIEKCEKYQGLAREIGGLWKSKAKVVQVVVEVLGHRN